MRKYRLVAKKGEGTFSEVLKAQNVKDSKFHAIKCMKNHFESLDQVNNLREIQALRRLSPHAHVVTLEEVLYDQPSGRLALVFELMDANLYELIRGRRHYLTPELIQSLMYQLVKALDHMHHKGIFHRDIKPENILVDDHSKLLKLADFGSCRGIYSKQPYTEYISTRWYRAPECLLTDGYYGPEMDMWGAGCVFFEITSLYPLFPGANELDQIHRVHKIRGTPSQDLLESFKKKGGAAHVDFASFPRETGTPLAKLVPHAGAAAVDLMDKMLAYDPSKRLNAREALRHEYFRNLRELDEVQQQQAQPQPQPQQGHAPGGAGLGQSSQVLAQGQPATTAVAPRGLHKSKHKEEPEGGAALPSIQSSTVSGGSSPHGHAPSGAHVLPAVDELPPIHGGGLLSNNTNGGALAVTGGGAGGAGGGGGAGAAPGAGGATRYRQPKHALSSKPQAGASGSKAGGFHASKLGRQVVGNPPGINLLQGGGSKKNGSSSISSMGVGTTSKSSKKHGTGAEPSARSRRK